MDQNFQEEFKRLGKVYRLMLTCNLNSDVAAALAGVFALYPINDKGKWIYDCKFFEKMNKNEKFGFLMRKLNAIANRQKINHNFLIGKNPLFKERELIAEKNYKDLSKENNKSFDIDAFKIRIDMLFEWERSRVINKEKYNFQNERIISLCKLIIDTSK